MSNIDCVIFDLDGTLIDGTEGILSSVKYLIKKHNLADISEEELLSFIGPPIQNSLKKVYNLTDEQAQIYANTFREKYKNEGYKRTGRAAWRTAKSVQGEKNPGDDRV